MLSGVNVNVCFLLLKEKSWSVHTTIAWMHLNFSKFIFFYCKFRDTLGLNHILFTLNMVVFDWHWQDLGLVCAHKLATETSFNKVDRTKRLCILCNHGMVAMPVCQKKLVELEFHFLIKWLKYDEILDNSTTSVFVILIFLLCYMNCLNMRCIYGFIFFLFFWTCVCNHWQYICRHAKQRSLTLTIII